MWNKLKCLTSFKKILYGCRILFRYFHISGILFNSLNSLKKDTPACVTHVLPPLVQILPSPLFSKSLRASHITKFNEHFFILWSHLVSLWCVAGLTTPLFWKDSITYVIPFPDFLLFLTTDVSQFPSLAFAPYMTPVFWCCSRLTVGFSFASSYMLSLRGYIHMLLNGIYFVMIHKSVSPVQIITLELQ